MSNFIASNGVELDKDGYRTDGIETVEQIHEARKEFYQQLRDKELGRWRDPEAPNFVVYPPTPDNPGWVRVVDEIAGGVEVYFRDWMGCSDYGDTAKRYFAAHSEPELKPELKPWHSATEGDLWEVKYPETAYIAMVSDKEEFVFTDKTSVPVTDENIITARRLWPGAV